MNPNHVINGWLAQLSVDARRRAGGGRAAREPASSTVDFSVAVEPSASTVDLSVAVEPVPPARTRGRLLPVRVWGRDGAPRRAAGGPCLSLG